MSEAIEAVLRGAGLTDKPGEFDSSIHSWRCEHPDRYGACDCFQSLVDDLAEVERAAAEKALARVRDLHQWNRVDQYDDRLGDWVEEYCTGCHEVWPCATIRALEGDDA